MSGRKHDETDCIALLRFRAKQQRRLGVKALGTERLDHDAVVEQRRALAVLDPELAQHLRRMLAQPRTAR